MYATEAARLHKTALGLTALCGILFRHIFAARKTYGLAY
jgi:hypothetical protein